MMELLKMKKEEFRQLCWLFRLFLIAIDIENYQSEDFKIGEFKYALRLTAVEHILHIELLKKNNPIVASLSGIDYFSQESLSFNFRTNDILNDYFELFFDGSKVIEENNNGRKNKIYW